MWRSEFGVIASKPSGSTLDAVRGRELIMHCTSAIIVNKSSSFTMTPLLLVGSVIKAENTLLTHHINRSQQPPCWDANGELYIQVITLLLNPIVISLWFSSLYIVCISLSDAWKFVPLSEYINCIGKPC